MPEARPPEASGRIARVLSELGLARAHFGAGLASELLPLIGDGSGPVASLTLVNPNRLETGVLANLGPALSIVTGDAGLPATVVREAQASLPEADVHRLEGYYTATWSDVVADRPELVRERLTRLPPIEAPRAPVEGRGEIAGITYRASGRGSPLVLLPLLLAPSQWEPVLADLSEHLNVIVLGGPHLGMVAMLESRGGEPGYQRVLASVFDELRLRPRERVLEVGCGTGVLARWIANRSGGGNPIVATDLNPYFLSEARALAERSGLGDRIDFREGNAESLPFEDDSFDVVFSSTVMEECDADRMLAELIRVARPGGRVAVVVRATDMRNVCTVEVSDDIRAKVEAPYPSVAERGCADASLYRRFRESALVEGRYFPHLLTLTDAAGAAWAYREPYIVSQLDPAQAGAWTAAKARAEREGTFVFSSGVHCAIGTKPQRQA